MSCIPKKPLAIITTSLFGCLFAIPGSLGSLGSLTNDNNAKQELTKALKANDINVQLGSRFFFLINDMDEGPLKAKLMSCSEGPFYRSNFSISHRGAPLQLPEHTKESYLAAARMGAGILECDVTFTQDRELVCRHSQCDLHTTTNILEIPELAAKCSVPFTPVEIDPATEIITKPANAQCCTSDITLAEFKTLSGKMNANNHSATTVKEYLSGTEKWRTDLYARVESSHGFHVFSR